MTQNTKFTPRYFRDVAALTPYEVGRMHLNDAADEIDRLRAELDEAVAMVNEMDAKDLELVSGAGITRIEIIDQTGRIFVAHETLSDVRLSFQDEGHTLKVFCHRRP